ncbi:MAG: hypothetical protein Tsb0021_15420 [Chlamydiales bacterium]
MHTPLINQKENPIEDFSSNYTNTDGGIGDLSGRYVQTLNQSGGGILQSINLNLGLFLLEIQRDFGSDLDFFGETNSKIVIGESKKALKITKRSCKSRRRNPKFRLL